MNSMDIAITVVLILVVILLSAISLLWNRSKKMERDLNYYKTTFLSKRGFYQGYGNYYLISLDGGANWYAAKREEKQIKIEGPAENIFPGLVSCLNGLDALTDYVLKNGPIQIGNLSQKDQALLSKAGITVQKT